MKQNYKMQKLEFQCHNYKIFIFKNIIPVALLLPTCD